MIKCEYCNSEFKTNFNLNKHQKTAKYCLTKQKDINLDDYEEIYFICQYCDKKFTSKYNLNLHHNNDNTCLILKENDIKKQLETIEELKKENKKLDKENKMNKINEEFKKTVDKLNKIITEKDNIISKLEDHLELREERINEEFKKTVDKLNKIITEKDNIISKLEDRLELREERINELKKQIDDTKHDVKDLCEKAINKPTTSNNNVINNNQRTKIEIKEFNLNSEYVSSKVSNKFNDNYIYDGMSGIAKFVKDHVITLEDGSVIYACFDNARRQFKYKDIYGNIIKDPKALKLIEMLQQPLKEQSKKLLKFFSDENDRCIEENINNKESQKIKVALENSFLISTEIALMHENTKFSTELANIIS
jgi:hypothetical protein